MNTPEARRIAGRDQIIESLSTFIQLSNQKNDYFLMSFGSKLHLLSDWTSDVGPLLGRIPVAHDKTNTSFYDALWAAVEKVKTGRNRKRVVLVVSDGVDNGSRHKLNDVRDFLKANDVLVYSLAVMGHDTGSASLSGMPAHIANIINARIASGGKQALIDFAEITGGLALFVDEAKQMNWMANRIATELRHQYRVEFETDSLKPGKWRRLKATIKPRATSTGEFKRLKLRTRQGYYSSADRIKRD
jgi:Ca-activated chloride channel family protein